MDKKRKCQVCGETIGYYESCCDESDLYRDEQGAMAMDAEGEE